MRNIVSFGMLALVVIGAGWFVQRGAEERAVRGVIEDVQVAALRGLSQRQPDALDDYFATEAEGAVPPGLAETQQAYKTFVAQLPGDNAVQVHSFDILGIEVHEDAGLAKVTYRVHFSVLRGGQAIFGAMATQDVALRKTPRGWRISGGDAPQLENVLGSWPAQ